MWAAESFLEGISFAVFSLERKGRAWWSFSQVKGPDGTQGHFGVTYPKALSIIADGAVPPSAPFGLPEKSLTFLTAWSE